MHVPPDCNFAKFASWKTIFQICVASSSMYKKKQHSRAIFFSYETIYERINMYNYNVENRKQLYPDLYEMEVVSDDVEWVTCDSPVNIALIKYCMYFILSVNSYCWITCVVQKIEIFRISSKCIPLCEHVNGTYMY